MVRRLRRAIFLISFSIPFFAPVVHASNIPMGAPDYSRLLNYIELQDLQSPLVAFGAAEKDFDRQLNHENITFLNKDKALLQQIQSQLKSEALKWRLAASFKQLLVVPEKRDEYARLFEQYCKTSVAYLLNRIDMPNPYSRIATLKGTLTSIPPPLDGSNGVTVYLVHNLADEYIEEYLFFSQDDDQTKIKIKLSNREFDGKVGSYTSHLKIGENNHFEFLRESYTLWQNSAENPLNVLIVPIEETLHILMRPFTEAAIQSDLAQSKPSRVIEVQHVVDDWMAVEEGIVGGVVSQIMPDLLTRFINQESADRLTGALAERHAHAQYRLLDQAIRVVSDMGIDEALAVYRKAPEDFRHMLNPQDLPPTMESAGSPQLSAQVN